MPEIIKINFSYNQLTAIQDLKNEDAVEIQRINLSHNGINQIDVEAFKHLK